MPPRRPAAPRGPAGRGSPRPRQPGRATSGGRQPASARPAPAATAQGAGGGRSGFGRLGFGRPVTVLAGVLVVLALLLTPQLRDWWIQQRQLNQMRADVAASQRQVQSLRAQTERWKDPAYVKAQARERLHLVMPGETGYVVIGPPPPPPARPAPGIAGVPVSGRPWFGNLWRSVQAAGAEPVNAPARP